MKPPTRADIERRVPAAATSWTALEAQKWVREEVLAGGPPDKPLNPTDGQPVDWANVGQFAGRNLRFQAKPMGLIFEMPDGSRQFYAGDATSSTGSSRAGASLSTAKMREQAGDERILRTFAQNELKLYNKTLMKQKRAASPQAAAREFWAAGKRIRTLLKEHPHLTQDQVWYSLEQWGRGADGYAKNWYEYAAYFYDWKPALTDDDPVLALSETRIMNIRRASKKNSERDALAEASARGALSDLSDDEFKWLTGQFLKTFPGDDALKVAWQECGRNVKEGHPAPTLGATLAAIRALPKRKKASAALPVEED